MKSKLKEGTPRTFTVARYRCPGLNGCEGIKTRVYSSRHDTVPLIPGLKTKVLEVIFMEVF
jgi:hypothetical protein